ncbi:universal stress protein [Yoonia sp. R2331]|uniref:universal stress protein n=1 Tax=Yoonia sp. R2331 TaxID=3237238 RepID=UPI0034E4BC0A
MFSKILIGVDGSDPALHALNAACDLAKACDAAIYLVHVPHPDTVAFATGAVAGYHMVTTMPDDKTVQAAAAKIIASATDIVTKAGCTVAESYTQRGDPGDMVIATAKEMDADLIVTGRRGLGNIAGLILGSTSQRISHHAHCAVLTVP